MPGRLTRILEGAVLAGALATVPLTLLGEENPAPRWVQDADWTVWAVFLVEYIAMVLASSERKAYVKRNPLNLAVIVLSYPHLPVLFGLVRLARFARVLRLLRLVGVTARAVAALRAIFWRRGVVCVTAISGFVILAGGAALTLLEPQTVRGGIADGIWWAVVTASTVGYGDIAPTTLWGRLIAVLLMLSGAGLISTLAASITAYFLGQGESAALVELKERTARIENLLSVLTTERVPCPRTWAECRQEEGPSPRTEPAKSAVAKAGQS
jgi:voltage-gated potassium channel